MLKVTVRRRSRPYKVSQRKLLSRIADRVEKAALDEAEALTSGAVPQSTLARLHPFSKFRPNASLPKLPINRHGGGLDKSWSVLRRSLGGRLFLFLRSKHPHAIVTRKGGTRTMVDRGFWQALKARLRVRVNKGR